jgi:hypothetical protein
MQDNNDPVTVSQQFIYAVKTENNAGLFVQELQALHYNELKMSLSSDKEKMAFWINVYNGFTHYLLQQNPLLYDNRNLFFSQKQVYVAGEAFSLDAIEHGILRRSKIKWSLGYLSKPFPSEKEKELRVTSVDFRIHFALNCGAKSCPPVAFYTPGKLEQQLQLATKNYLAGEVRLDERSGTIWLPKVMLWFWKDFGGRKGILKLLHEYGYGNAAPSTKFHFNRYNWQMQLHHFTNSDP